MQASGAFTIKCVCVRIKNAHTLYIEVYIYTCLYSLRLFIDGLVTKEWRCN